MKSMTSSPQNLNHNFVEIKDFISAIWSEGDVRELRLISKENKKDIVYGYFDSQELAAVECHRWQNGRFCYITLNPVDPQLMARIEQNKFHIAKQGESTGDNNVIECRYILIDCDAKKPSNTSSTNEQIQESEQLAQKVIAALGKPYIYGFSGNGYHCIYKIVGNTTTEERKIWLSEFSKKHKTSTANIDTTVFNAAQLTKILGTWAIKGQNMPMYPHRQSHIIEINQDSSILDIHINQAQQKKEPMPEKKKNIESFDSVEFVKKILSEKCGYREEKRWNDSTMFVLDACVFDPSHSGKDASIIVPDNGPIIYKCLHDSCSHRTWNDFKQAVGYVAESSYSRVIGTSCKYCGMDDLVWGEYDGKSRLFNRDGVLHSCKKNKEVKTVKKEESHIEKTDLIDVIEGEQEETIEGIDRKTFPIDSLPSVLKNFVIETARDTSSNEEFVFLSALVAMSVARQGSTIYVRKKWEDEVLSIYGACVGETGQGKSPAIRAALEPIKYLSRQLDDRYSFQKDQYKETLTDYEEILVEWRKNKKILSKPDKPEQPEEKIIAVSNSTVEALSRYFKSSPAILLQKDELTGWIKSFGQYKAGHGDDREFFLSAWSGDSIKIIRAGKNDSLSLPEKPCLSVIGGIVPENLSSLRNKEDGFIERILFVYPEEKSRKFSFDENEGLSSEDYRNTIIEIYNRGKMTIRIESEAKQLFSQYHDYADTRKTENPKIRGSMSKFPSQCLRIAAILASFELKDQIDEINMQRSIDLCCWLEKQMIKVLNISSVSKEISSAQKIMEWARRKEKKIVSARDIVIYTRAVSKTQEARDVMLEMVNIGLASWEVEFKKIKIL